MSEHFLRRYQGVPEEQRERLRRFREAHAPRRLTVAGHEWEYLVGGRGERTLLMVPGGSRVGEAHVTISSLEPYRRVISPTYPMIRTMAEATEGLVALLDAEGVKEVDVLGASLGGMVAQCLAQRHPERIRKLVLSHTAPPQPGAAGKWRRAQRFLRMLPAAWVRGIARKRLQALTKAVPEDQRAFYTAYFAELLEERLPKEWFLCEYALLIDFARNYSFTPEQTAAWSEHVVILESEQDEMISPEARAALKALYPRAEVHNFSHSGHLVTLDGHEAFVEAVLQGLGAVENTKAAGSQGSRRPL